MSGTLFYAFFLSLLIGTTLTPIFMAAAMKFGVVDHPGHRKVHKEPVARAGGLAFAIGALLPIGLWSSQQPILLGIVLGTLIIVGLGSLDDFCDLRAWIKFLGQMIAASITVLSAQLSWQPLSGLVGMEWPSGLAVPLMIVFFVMVTNAVNFSDGLDGLAGGLTFLSFGMVAYLAYQLEDSIVLHLTLPVLGGLLGFLRFNSFPARVFMGDGGSQFLGFGLAATTVLLTDSSRSPLSPLLVLFLIGVPLLDLIAVITQRLLTGTSPFKADQRHLHHQLLHLGFSHHQVVLLMYALQLLLLLIAYLLRWSSDVVLAGGYVLVLVIVGGFLLLVSRTRLPFPFIQAASQGPLHWRTWIHSAPRLSHLAVHALGVAIIGFLILSLLLPLTISYEIALASVVIVVVLALGFLTTPHAQLFMTRMGLYLGTTIVLYLTQEFVHHQFWGIQLVFQGFFGLLIIFLLLAIHLDEENRFQTNPMDYLLLFLALVIPYFPAIVVNDIDLGSLMAKLIVLFFACEVLLQAFFKKAHHFGYVSAITLLGIGLHSLL